jgi:two-component system, NarL family, sensor kinase
MWKFLRPAKTAEGAKGSDPIRRLAAENERMLDRLAQMQDRFRSLGRSAWRVQEDERRRLARELHDGVGQDLTALRHLLERVEAGQERDQCSELLVRIIEDVRELSRLLRPPILDDLGLAAALAWLGRRARDNGGVEVEVRTDCLDGLELSAELSTLIFRLAQEALNNAQRHAQAGRITIRTRLAGTRLEIEISDDGIGFNPKELGHQTERGIGLASMRDRVELFGGDLSIRSTPGRGTTVLVGLDIREAKEGAP